MTSGVEPSPDGAARPGAESGRANDLLAQLQGSALRRPLAWLMGGRLTVTSLLFGGVLYTTWDPVRGFGGFTTSFMLSLIGATFLATVGFGFWTISRRNPKALIVAQLTWDLLLATGLIYCTGGAGSALAALYEIIILMAALTLGPRGLTSTSSAALLLYTVVGVSLSTGWLAPPPDQDPRLYLLATPDLGFALLSNLLGLLLVAVLAGGLATRLRRAGGELQRAQASAARYARLAHDIVRCIGSGLATTDLGGRIETLNPSGTAMLGGSDEDWIGRPATDFLPDLEGREATSLPERGEGLGTRLDGTRFPLGFTSSALRGTNDEPIGTLISFRDLTEIGELRRRADHAKRLAFLGQLAAGVAHEVRNPLSSISGSVQMVKSAPGLDAEDRGLMAIVLTEVERLDHLVRAMLTAGKPQDPVREKVDLASLVREIGTVAALGRASQRQIEVAVAAPSGSVWCWGDEDALRQVTWNLLDNAISAAPTSSVVEIAVREEEDSCWLVVGDEGAGIAPAARDGIFELFSSGRAHGVGIGMALVRQIVDRLGGQVELGDRPSRGTEVRVRLIRAEPSDETRRAQDPPSAEVDPPQPPSAEITTS